jgi:hypothetical protein
VWRHHFSSHSAWVWLIMRVEACRNPQQTHKKQNQQRAK